MKENKKEIIIFLAVVLIVSAMIYYVVCEKKIREAIEDTNLVNDAQQEELMESSSGYGVQEESAGGPMTVDMVEGSRIIDTTKWDLSRVNIVEDADGIPVPVPKGYVASQVDGEKRVMTGFVIYEGEEPVTGKAVGMYSTEENSAWVQSCKRNQWVWVPVADVSRIYDKEEKKSKLWSYSNTGRSTYTNSNYEPGITSYDNEMYLGRNNMTAMTREELLEEIEITLEETAKSIEKYGGYYIGRYETGNLNERKPVVVRMNDKINNLTWYDSYSRMLYLGANENVRASMISGALWDETLQWFKESGAKTYAEIANSENWGNHYESTFTYRTISGGNENKNSGNTMVPTGSSEHNKANNIYDMAGNVSEWTLEMVKADNINGRRSRGGTFNDNASQYSVSYRGFNTPDNANRFRRSACLFLYKIVRPDNL